jgi:16S rRNA (guanine527-N7)-methyltransferase
VSLSHILRREASHFGLTLTENQLQACEIYSQELLAWNERVNLTGITDPAEIAVKHFLDSLSLYPLLESLSAPFSLIDVGSGAGFPGLALKIARPDTQLTLLESVGKKTAFLYHIVTKLNFSQVTVLTARAEDVGQQATHREKYDVAVARAVAALPVLAEYNLPLVKIGGQVILPKGQHPAEELQTAQNAINVLGGRVERVIPLEVPGLTAKRHGVVLQKINPTPQQYPRRPGLPAKRPL